VHYRKIETILPAALTEAERRRLERVSRLTYRALGCRDYARMDIRLRNGIFFVLDVNPNADISFDASMAFAAEEAGYSYGAMGSYIARLAARRHAVFAPRRRRRRTETLAAMTAAE
jgi:D-alanine-D-alanine ligase